MMTAARTLAFRLTAVLGAGTLSIAACDDGPGHTNGFGDAVTASGGAGSAGAPILGAGAAGSSGSSPGVPAGHAGVAGSEASVGGAPGGGEPPSDGGEPGFGGSPDAGSAGTGGSPDPGGSPGTGGSPEVGGSPGVGGSDGAGGAPGSSGGPGFGGTGAGGTSGDECPPNSKAQVRTICFGADGVVSPPENLGSGGYGYYGSTPNDMHGCDALVRTAGSACPAKQQACAPPASCDVSRATVIGEATLQNDECCYETRICFGGGGSGCGRPILAAGGALVAELSRGRSAWTGEGIAADAG